jgi:predicted nucleic acid-binding protein
MKHYLLDASAFMLLIKKADAQSTIECLRDSSVLDLTYYEVGNAVWKESCLTKLLTPEGTKTLQRTAQIILMKMDRVSSDPEALKRSLKSPKPRISRFMTQAIFI